MQPGLDYLGGAMFSSVLLKAHPQGFGAGFFAETFGNCWPVIDKLCASGKCPFIRVHGPWTNHRYIPSVHDKAIFTAFTRVSDLAGKYPRVHFQFSPVCESDGRGKDWASIFDHLQHRNSQDVELVCSIYQGEPVKGILLEIHGNKAAPTVPYQYGYDGKSSVDSNADKDKDTYRNAKIVWFWHQSFNLKYKTKLGKQSEELPNVWKNDNAAPKQRVCKPTVELILSVAALAERKGDCKLKPRNLWKSHADRHQTPPEPRAYKPVFITPAKVNQITLLDAVTNKIIAISNKREPYNDGRWRYYFGSYGYQIANRVLTVMAGATILGTVNPSFREGDYR